MKCIGLAKRGIVIAATCMLLVSSGSAPAASGVGAARSVELTLGPNDVIPTGNDWIALPSIRASDGAIQIFNVISMRYRGLLEVAGVGDRPLMAPFIEIAGVRRPLSNLHWSMRDYWIPTGTMEADDQPYGLPGSYRLPFTTSWEVADHLRLKAGRAQALKILKHSPWDGGIITEGAKADTGIPDTRGLAVATAAGYVAHAICEQYCVDRDRRAAR